MESPNSLNPYENMSLDDIIITECTDDHNDQYFKAFMDVGSSTREGRKRAHIDRGHVEGQQRLFDEYFFDELMYIEYQFRRRFRMCRHVFLCIVQALENHSEYFQMRFNVVGRRGLSPLQKCIAAIRMFAYRVPTNYVDEYVRIGQAPRVEFTINDTQYNKGYYLAYGIYPEWGTFVKTIPLPQVEKRKLFSRFQEAIRKDVERAFRVLQSHFAILRRLARFWQRDVLTDNMYTCIILHNIIVEDERDAYESLFDFNFDDSHADTPTVEVLHRPNSDFPTMLQRSAEIRDKNIHRNL
ncbi:uncharacterized protein LOC133779180 [Humulus lupulus]|uniref:uncharacterized protein LOC133779180 n=1 Tax=Humulus lupulus TaxID=3486 RepID=UPI002B413E62|nr:uncharacterized protein LOC133779180 [Humulus lupulus]